MTFRRGRHFICPTKKFFSIPSNILRTQLEKDIMGLRSFSTQSGGAHRNFCPQACCFGVRGHQVGDLRLLMGWTVWFWAKPKDSFPLSPSNVF